MEFWKILIVAVSAYLLGSVNVAIIITKLFMRKDVRKYGSHNAGATNVARSFGLPLGIATMLGDFGKTVLSMLIGRWVLGDNGMLMAAGACIIGHCFPVYFRFKGGKGVATAGCIALMIEAESPACTDCSRSPPALWLSREKSRCVSGALLSCSSFFSLPNSLEFCGSLNKCFRSGTVIPAFPIID